MANPAAISTIAWVTANVCPHQLSLATLRLKALQAASESKRAIQIGILIGIGQTCGAP